MRYRDISIKANRIARVSPLSPSQQQTRRKSAVTKAWFVVSNSGESRIEEVGKYSIMRRTGLPARDLRILDPMLSYPSTVLGRERAIVFNLEGIKAIITATEVLVLSSKSPLVSALVEDLQHHVLNLHGTPRQAAESSDTDMGVTNKGPRYSPSFLSHHKPESPSSMGISQQRHVSLENSMMIPEMKDCSPRSELDGPKDECPKVRPFEFRVLEVCLQSACKCLESEVRDELENLLDDDMDMAEMYLTDKLDHQQYEETLSTDEVDDDAFKIDDERDEDSRSKAKSGYVSLNGFRPNIEELEMLLEAYFTQTEGTLSKLSTLREYVDDIEDYITIMLDDKQNHLLQMAVMISTAIVVITLADITIAVLSMNIEIKLFDATQSQFLEMAFGVVGCCVVLYIIAIGLGRKTGLLG